HGDAPAANTSQLFTPRAPAAPARAHPVATAAAPVRDPAYRPYRQRSPSVDSSVSAAINGVSGNALTPLNASGSTMASPYRTPSLWGLRVPMPNRVANVLA